MKVKMLLLAGLSLLLILAVACLMKFDSTEQKVTPTDPETGIKYLPLGDSYTIGNGVLAEDRWPNVLTKHLNEAGIKVRLIGNPAVSGYSVEDAVTYELPVVEQLKPDFVTVLIGANDNFRETDPEIYQQELSGFLDELQKHLGKPESIILITIPDYSKSPAAAGYDNARISESIEEYNEIIKNEASKRNLKVADIFPVSQTMIGREDYISDGLHPSALGYAKWEKVIYPVVFDFLKQ